MTVFCLNRTVALLIVALASCAEITSATTPVAASPDQRPPLWGELRMGMSKAEARAAMPPTEQQRISKSCGMDFYPSFKRKALIALKLEYGASDYRQGAQCGLMVEEILIRKYGDPIRQGSMVDARSCGNATSGVAGALAKLCSATGGDDPNISRSLHWQRGPVAIVLRVDADGKKWWLEYSPADVADVGVSNRF